MWSYPKAGESREAAVFNMVNALLARIHQAGQIADLSAEQSAAVREGIALYKSQIRADKLWSLMPAADRVGAVCIHHGLWAL